MQQFRFSVRPNRAHLIEWRPWGEAAFAAAQAQGKPIFLALVAYWCGSCQRMDEVTLSDPEIIRLLNAQFLPARVEEAQRPDINARYMHNGWPTFAVLTEEGDLLFALNSLGPRPMADVLTQAAGSYAARRDELLARAREARPGPGSPPPAPEPLDGGLVARIAGVLQGLADPVNGGYGRESKFPHPEANDFFLYLYETTGHAPFLEHVLLTLRKMRQGSLHHEEGGYYRYSSRLDWEQPHPEKLLDDQAGVLRNLLHAFLLSEDEFFSDAARELIGYMDATLLDGDTGVFFGCQDYVRRAAAGPDGVEAPIDSYLDRCLYADQNARAASAYLQAWLVLGDEGCRRRATHVLDWLWQNLRDGDGAMYHYWDGEPLVAGLLGDSLAVGAACLEAYGLLGDVQYLQRALALAAGVLARHRDAAGGFADISAPGPGALRRPLALPQLNAAAAAFFTRLAALSGDDSYRAAAYWALWPFRDLEAYGALAAGFGEGLGRYHAPACLARLRGVAGSPALRALARAALTRLSGLSPVFCFQPVSRAEAAGLTVEVAGRASRLFQDPEDVGVERLLDAAR